MQSNRTPESSEERWRVFCAIEVPAQVCAPLVGHINQLREAFPNIHASWSRDGKFHITLKFFGEVRQLLAQKLSLAAARAIAGFSVFNLTVGATGAFPRQGPPRVLWIGIDDESGRLAKLQTRLDEECAHEGFSREERPFHPHLTIARLRKPQGAPALAAAHKAMGFKSVQFTVSELLVIRSELGSEGSKYTIVSRHELANSANI
jgi:RNA 2',3'-cyclic 3'-phosphodiesterase